MALLGSRAARRDDTATAGRRAEVLACRYLEDQGLVLVVRNYRCKCGEIDLVMNDGAALVFVEVRYRRSGRFGSAAESVDARKRRKLAAAAAHYMQTQRGASDRAARFDVVSISGPDAPCVEWIRDAFGA